MANNGHRFLKRALCGALSALFMVRAWAQTRAQTWQAVGPKPIASAEAVFDQDLAGPLFDAAGRVTAIAAVATVEGQIFVGTAKCGLWMVTTEASISPLKRNGRVA